MGRKAKEFTPDELKLMVNMASVGITQEQIAKVMGVSTKTLHNKVQKELEAARLKGVASIAGALFKNAQKGNVTAQIFIMKTQAGWRETGPDNNQAALPDIRLVFEGQPDTTKK